MLLYCCASYRVVQSFSNPIYVYWSTVKTKTICSVKVDFVAELLYLTASNCAGGSNEAFCEFMFLDSVVPVGIL